jgi:hypothetical protein
MEAGQNTNLLNRTKIEAWSRVCKRKPFVNFSPTPLIALTISITPKSDEVRFLRLTILQYRI